MTEQRPPLPLESSADYLHIDLALKSLWESFEKLRSDIDTFAPRPLSDYDDERDREIERLMGLNPHATRESIAELVGNQIAFAASERVQFVNNFSDRFMTLYVTVAVLSNALCEAAINAILALGLTEHGTPEVFGLLERSELREKWRFGPKAFLPSYHLNPGQALCQSLNELVKRRNVLVHYKTHVKLNGETVVQGSKFERQSFQDGLRWIERFFSLPYDLVDHFRGQVTGYFTPLLYDSRPIKRSAVHAPPTSP